VTVDARLPKEPDLSQIRELQIGFAPDGARRFRKSRAFTEQDQRGKDAGESSPARGK
jgi:hypothetical protein